MTQPVTPPVELRRYRDAVGNVYGVERSIKTGRWIVVRINPGGNRKLATAFKTLCGNRDYVQSVLDSRHSELELKPIGFHHEYRKCDAHPACV